MWSALFLTLPTQPNAVRLRVWRALKARGSMPLRDGVYLLPAAQAALFEPLAAEVQAHGGQASVFELRTPSATQQAELLVLFDRSAAYAQWQADAQALAHALPSLGEAQARRQLRQVAEALHAVHKVDYFPGAAAAQAQAELAALRQALDAGYTRGEPLARAGHGIARLDARKFQGKRWATRARPWVDRLACAWLIRRFIDPQARFVWLSSGAQAPRGALGFDYDGARFSHVGARVTLEVLAASFGLAGQPALQRLARVVHYLDVGGIPVPEAAGLEAVLAGLRALHADDDDALAAAAASVFEAFYAAPGAPA